MIKTFLSSLFALLAFAASAQDNAPQMADTFRQDGKIYVVITVIGLIFAAIVLFLIYLERKVKRLENKIESQKEN